jgi:hypothetical protein
MKKALAFPLPSGLTRHGSCTELIAAKWQPAGSCRRIARPGNAAGAKPKSKQATDPADLLPVPFLTAKSLPRTTQ